MYCFYNVLCVTVKYVFQTKDFHVIWFWVIIPKFRAVLAYPAKFLIIWPARQFYFKLFFSSWDDPSWFVVVVGFYLFYLSAFIQILVSFFLTTSENIISAGRKSNKCKFRVVQENRTKNVLLKTYRCHHFFVFKQINWAMFDPLFGWFILAALYRVDIFCLKLRILFFSLRGAVKYHKWY